MFALKENRAQTKAGASSGSRLAPQRSTFAARPFGASAVDQLQVLQRGIGNQAMLRLLAQRATRLIVSESHEHDEQVADPAAARAATPGASWDFSRIPAFAPDRVNRGQVQSVLEAGGRPLDL